ncbi:isoprenyl transferase [Deferribacterales bacterium RsTz2092]
MPQARHVAVIMDRNGEWAKKRAFPRIMGHREGAKAVKRIIKAAVNLNVPYLSLFAFSTENWSRPAEEVKFLMNLLGEFIKKEMDEFINEGARLVISGRTDRIPKPMLDAVHGVVARSANNSKVVVHIALDYGGRDEIVRAAQRLAENVKTGDVNIVGVDETAFRGYLDQPELPDVDLLIRTGGEQRISNFMLWQAAYAELYFTPTYWPDFTEEDLKLALTEFDNRHRRFGKTDEQMGRS